MLLEAEVRRILWQRLSRRFCRASEFGSLLGEDRFMVAEKAARAGSRDYVVNSCEPGDLSVADRAACVGLVETGGAVRRGAIAEGIAAASLLSVVRLNGEIVGVGAIKQIRRLYGGKIASRCGVRFPPETPEFGYVAVDPKHHGNGLSHRLAEEMIAKHSGPLFATTSSDRMIATLTAAGFEKKGREWPGRDAALSFWWRDDKKPKGKI
jgi:GNAT superfamily N-acetyltransferase